MLVTNTEIKSPNEACMEKRISLMRKIGRALDNGFSKIIAAELNNTSNSFGHVELAMCVKQSMNKGLSDHQNL